MSQEPGPGKIRFLRLRALVVALPVVLGLGGVSYLLLDSTVERTLEDVGADIVGARVDVDAADVQIGDGRIVLERLQVANPNAPFTNLFEAEQVVVDVRIQPLLERKLVADSFVVRGVRFATPRETSGALDNLSPESGRLWREVSAWADGLQVPELRLDGIGGIVNVDAIDDDSLATLTLGRTLVVRIDSLGTHWQAEIRRLDPRPVLDSAHVLATRLGDAQRTRPSLVTATQLIGSTRRMVTRLEALQSDVQTVDSAARADVGNLRLSVTRLESAVDADVAYARRLLRLPSLDAPNLSPVLFHETAISWLKPVLYWVRAAERVLPPGLDPALRPGPQRRRAPGTTVTFPGHATYPRFLLDYGALDLHIGGTGLGAGRYDGVVRGLSSAPSLSSLPIEVEVNRTGARRGPEAAALRAVLHHGERPIRDSVRLSLGGVGLPSVDIPDLEAKLLLGQGDAEFALTRVGQEIDATLRWVSSDIRWEGQPNLVDDPELIGSNAWIRAFLWRTLTGVRRLELEMGIRGSLSGPSLRIRSNLGEVFSQSLSAEVGTELRRAERQLRAEVVRRVQPAVSEAEARIADVETTIVARVGPLASEVRELRRQLDEAVAELVRRIPEAGGV